MLHLDVAVGDALVIDDGRIVIRFDRKSGQQIRVGVDADRSIPVKVVSAGASAPWAKGLTRNSAPRKSGAPFINPRAHEGSTDGNS